MVFVEDVLGIILLVEERQRHGRLGVGESRHIVGIDAVALQKFDDVLPDVVVAGLGDERCADPAASQRRDGIEGRTSGNRLDGFVVFEDDVQYGFADTNNFPHFIVTYVMPGFTVQI